MNLLLPTVAALVSILILPWWSFSFDVIPKVAVALMGGCVAFILSWKWPVPQTWRFKWFVILCAGYAAAMAIAAVFSTHPRLSWFGSAWRRTGLPAEFALLILVVMGAGRLAADRTSLRLLLRITVLAALPVALYGIAQYFGIDPLLDPAGYHFGAGRFTIVRPPSTLGHAAYFATVLLYAVFGGVALALSEPGKGWKAVGLTVSGMTTFAIVLSGTRAALAGLVVGALFLGARRLEWKWIATAFTILAAVAAFYVSPAGERLRARVFWSSEDQLGGARPLLWRDTLRMSAGRWWVGYGPETFSVEFPRHQSVELARAFPDFYHESPHNIFLDALVSKGILGLLALAALAVVGVASARGPLGAAFVAMLVSQQFTSFTLPTELYFFMCLAILVSGRDSAGSITILQRPWQWGLALAFASVAIYVSAGDFLLGAARRALDRGDVDAAARLVNRARQWNASSDLYFSRRFLMLPTNDPAVRFRAWRYAMSAAARAPQTVDDPQNALLNLAALYARANDAAAVERSLREAIAISPNWFKPHWLLAQVLARDGRMAEAEMEAQVAVDRNGGKDPEVTHTFEQLRRR